MNFSGLFPHLVLLALGILAPWGVEGEKSAIKAGACPARKPVQCLKREKPECSTDWGCPGKQRCCQDTCGFKCLNPVPIPRPVKKKSGSCLRFAVPCRPLPPLSQCQNDGQCDGKYKCCQRICGKFCFPPK
uniref:Antileukoproteinase-like 2 n=1 Tax=Rattus norvegicus TaxID=10116 RepID=Q6IE42_RAT|nr:TPA: antileukoproteinase-like 2 precursor [Rattus norvegicus]|eukprot:NP_001008872.1 antileukoproteinase-like 2 precursor [Rattus norvegicus]